MALDYVTPSEYLSAQLGIAAQSHICSTMWLARTRQCLVGTISKAC